MFCIVSFDFVDHGRVEVSCGKIAAEIGIRPRAGATRLTSKGK
jgi:hypothetical protein